MICPKCKTAGRYLTAGDLDLARATHRKCVSFEKERTQCDCGHSTEGSAIQKTYRGLRKLSQGQDQNADDKIEANEQS